MDAGRLRERLPLTQGVGERRDLRVSGPDDLSRHPRGHEDVYVELEEALVARAAERNFRELDGIIRYYRKCADELDDREPSDRNGAHISPVGDRYALNGDFDAKGGKTISKAVNAALDMPTDGDERLAGETARRRDRAHRRVLPGPREPRRRGW